MLLVIQTSVRFMWMACQPCYCHICEGSGQNEIVFFKEMKGWQREPDNDQGTQAGAVLELILLTLHFACIITHSLSGTLLYSVTLHLFSFLPHFPFILDLLYWWWWWVPLYNTKLSVRNTKQNWDRFFTLHRSLWRIAPFDKSIVLHSAPQVCFVHLFGSSESPHQPS